MKKRLMSALFLFFVLAIPVAMGVTLYEDTSTVVSGRNITLHAVSSNLAVIGVDGVEEKKEAFSLNKIKTINGVKIKVTEIVYFGPGSDNYATFDAEVLDPITCPDGDCSEEEEDSGSCCLDCECDSGYTCTDNVCIKDDCVTDDDCRDANNCTLDKCKGEPRGCVITPITECVINDWCCPAGCYYPDDPDCSETESGEVVTEEEKEEAEREEEEEEEEGENIFEIPQTEEVSFFRRIFDWFLDIFVR